MHYKISDRATIVSHVNGFLDLFSSIEGKKCLNSLTKTLSENEIQNLIYMLVGKNTKYSNPISDIIIRECIKSESISSGSGIIILKLLSYYFSKEVNSYSRKERLKNQELIRQEIVKSCENLSTYLRRANREDIKNLIDDIDISENLKEKLFKIIQEYSIGERLEVKKSSISESYISKIEGNFLPIEVASLFLRAGNWERESVSILLIDGTIEGISQIHHLLESASSKKEPFVIFCRSASEEVRETIGVNFIRSTIDLVLVETDFYPKYHHLFRDMSAIFGCEFVSVSMGDTLSSRISKFKFKVDRVKINPRGITFHHNGRREDDIKKYISEIRDVGKRLSDQDPDSYDEIKNSIDFRTKFLDSSTIILNIGQDDLTESGSEISKIDSFIRSISDIGSMGVVDLSGNIDIPDIIEESVSKSKEAKIYTQKQILHSLIASFRIYETINRAEKLFTVEN